jgi:hypothetical protein
MFAAIPAIETLVLQWHQNDATMAPWT